MVGVYVLESSGNLVRVLSTGQLQIVSKNGSSLCGSVMQRGSPPAFPCLVVKSGDKAIAGRGKCVPLNQDNRIYATFQVNIRALTPLILSIGTEAAWGWYFAI